ncbi:MAG: YtxH domain-containing protein [Candidatus Accumulibacter sp.]|jgi:hypothetical protein|nr:YtxH domain-containing protein [Accumulibacter sp.]
MSKKKLKKMLRKMLENEYGQQGAAEYENSAPGEYGRPGSKGSAAGRGLLKELGLPRGLSAGTTEQFVIGALLGAAAAYVLADEELRGKIMKSVLKLYTGLAGSVEEFKEQMADVKAEIEAEHGA